MKLGVKPKAGKKKILESFGLFSFKNPPVSRVEPAPLNVGGRMGGGAGTKEEEEAAVSCKQQKKLREKLTCLVVVVVDGKAEG